MREIDRVDDFLAWAERGEGPVALQAIDLSGLDDKVFSRTFDGCLVLGCKLTPSAAGHIVESGGLVIGDRGDYQFSIHRAQLYTPREIYNGFDPEDPNGYHATLDYRIYAEYVAQGRENPSSIAVSLARRLHDHSITDALMEVIEGRSVVAVMGGHGLERASDDYAKVARVARRLTQAGYHVATGGGPGAMEAANLGAYFSSFEQQDLADAIASMATRPEGGQPGREYADSDWLHRAWRVLETYPLGQRSGASLGIPTWLYGHEPPNPFSTDIAKYFANSVREDGLVTIAKHGIIFAPGSAGTTQEIFQDATQNHYGTLDCISPMILMGVEHWSKKRPVWPLLQQVAHGRAYAELLALTDDEDEVVHRITSYRPENHRTA